MDTIEKIFVINLKHRPERLKLFLENAPPSLDYTVFEAINGRTLKGDENMLHEGFIETGKRWKCGVLGALASHLQLWKKVTGNVLIFEDDVLFHNAAGFVETWNTEIIPLLPLDFDILTLDHGQHHRKKERDLPPFVSPIPNGKYGQYSYVISPRGAQKLLDSFKKTPASRSVDDECNWIRHSEFSIHWITPALCFHPLVNESDIQGVEQSVFLGVQENGK